MAERDFTRDATRDGLEIPLWVTLPAPGLPAGPTPGSPLGPAPAVVLVHGGPWVRGSAWGWTPMAQFLASRGYIVLEPEFRGSTGFGRQHFKAGRPPQAVGYEGEGHSWLMVATRVDLARRLEAFLQASLAAEPPAPR